MTESWPILNPADLPGMKMAVQAIITANDAVNSKVITTGKEVKAVFEEVLKFKTELLENKTKEMIRHLDIMSHVRSTSSLGSTTSWR